jgi:Kinesin motor domain
MLLAMTQASTDWTHCVAAWLWHVSWTLTVLQLYNEVVNDLLDVNNKNLAVKMETSAGVHVVGLSEQLVYSVDEVMELMRRGDAARKVGETKMNECSSRSHSIFRMVRDLLLQQCCQAPDDVVHGRPWHRVTGCNSIATQHKVTCRVR